MSWKEKDLLIFLDENEIDIFTRKELHETYGLDRLEYEAALRNLVTKGILSTIERGKYCRHTFRDEYVIGSYLTEDATVAYWSALHLHGLTEQFPNNVFIQSTKLKRNKTIFGVSYKFVKIDPRKMTGVTLAGYGNNRYRITDVEKTIADCFDLPHYSGGYPELIRALADANIRTLRLWEYLNSIGNLSAIKRIAWISQVLGLNGFTRFRERAKEMMNEKYTLLDPFGPNKGNYLSEWKLRINISEDDIREITKSAY